MKYKYHNYYFKFPSTNYVTDDGQKPETKYDNKNSSNWTHKHPLLFFVPYQQNTLDTNVVNEISRWWRLGLCLIFVYQLHMAIQDFISIYVFQTPLLRCMLIFLEYSMKTRVLRWFKAWKTKEERKNVSGHQFRGKYILRS